ncbi:MAG: M48 family metallopeptidase [Methanobacteriaceae archaeon]|nr:M48 family metallopeptidase [Methanobacteriaceae archaeon]
MAKDDRSGLNPFTGKKHLDLLNDDSFLRQSYGDYNKIISQSTLLDNTSQGQLVTNVAINLIKAIENYLMKIGRYDYIENYYDWEFHLVGNDTVNAFCMPGGKIVVFSGLLSIAHNEEEIAFILAHEISHALLDHSRTQQSARNVKTGLEGAALVGSIIMDLTGHHDLANATRGITIAADIGSEFLLMKPFGRTHEIEADKLGIMIMHWAGYNIHNIPTFWQAMSAKSPNNHDFFSTHPSDSKRIEAMKELINEIDLNIDFYSHPVLSDLKTKIDKSNSNENSLDNTKVLDKFEIPQTQPTLAAIPQNSMNHGESKGFKVIKDKFCTNCGHPIANNDFFCTNCGNKVSVKCSKCGMDIKPNTIFCTNCGCKLEF